MRRALAFTLIALFLSAGPALAADKSRDKAAPEMHPQVAWTLYLLNDHSQAMKPLAIDADKVDEKHQAAESLRQQASLLSQLAERIDALAAAWPGSAEFAGWLDDSARVELDEGAVPPGHRVKMTLREIPSMLAELKAHALETSGTLGLRAELMDPQTEEDEGEEVADAG